MFYHLSKYDFNRNCLIFVFKRVRIFTDRFFVICPGKLFKVYRDLLRTTDAMDYKFQLTDFNFWFIVGGGGSIKYINNNLLTVMSYAWRCILILLHFLLFYTINTWVRTVFTRNTFKKNIVNLKKLSKYIKLTQHKTSNQTHNLLAV